MTDSLSRNNAIIYSLEQNTHRAIDRFSRLAAAKQAPFEEYLKNGSLIFVPRDELPTIAPHLRNSRPPKPSVRSPNRTPRYNLNKWKSKRRMLICDPTVLAKTFSIEHLIAFECQTGKDFSNSVNVICVYLDDKWIERFSFTNLVSILGSHDGTIHDGLWYRAWPSARLFELIRDGMVAFMGESTADMVFKTLRMVYGMDEATIIAKPELFQTKLGKLLGFQTTQMILTLIINQLRKECSFNRNIAK